MSAELLSGSDVEEGTVIPESWRFIATVAVELALLAALVVLCRRERRRVVLTLVLAALFFGLEGLAFDMFLSEARVLGSCDQSRRFDDGMTLSLSYYEAESSWLGLERFRGVVLSRSEGGAGLVERGRGLEIYQTGRRATARESRCVYLVEPEGLVELVGGPAFDEVWACRDELRRHMDADRTPEWIEKRLARIAARHRDEKLGAFAARR